MRLAGICRPDWYPEQSRHRLWLVASHCSPSVATEKKNGSLRAKEICHLWHRISKRDVEYHAKRDTIPSHDCVLCAICCQAEACLMFLCFAHKRCGNAKAGKITAVRSLFLTKHPTSGRISLNAQKSGGSGSQQQ